MSEDWPGGRDSNPDHVVQSPAAYQALLECRETVEALQRGFADVQAGRTRPAGDVFNRLRRKHGMSR